MKCIFICDQGIGCNRDAIDGSNYCDMHHEIRKKTKEIKQESGPLGFFELFGFILLIFEIALIVYVVLKYIEG